jgi:hypothetical protein
MPKASKKTKQDESKVLVAEPTEEEINRFRDIVKEVTYPTNDKDLITDYLKLDDTKNRTLEQEKKKDKLLNEIVALHGLENGGWVSNIGRKSENIRGLVKIRQDLIKEYQCKTPSELILVDNIIASYWRSMRYEMYIHSLIEKDGGYSFDQLKVNVLNTLHKGIDLAQVSQNMNLTMLQGMKQPKLNIKVKTENAYIAQNQQVINNEPAHEPSQPQDIEGEVK